MAKLILLLAVVLTFCGCKPSEQDQTSLDVSGTNAATDASRKERLIAQMGVELSKLEGEVAVLGAKIQSGSETVKAEAQPKLDALKAKIADLDQQLHKAGTTSASKWDDFKAGFEKSSEDVKNSINQARQWLSDKIAPAASTK